MRESKPSGRARLRRVRAHHASLRPNRQHQRIMAERARQERLQWNEDHRGG